VLISWERFSNTADGVILQLLQPSAVFFEMQIHEWIEKFLYSACSCSLRILLRHSRPKFHPFLDSVSNGKTEPHLESAKRPTNLYLATEAKE
jgi:hypothetical protein